MHEPPTTPPWRPTQWRDPWRDAIEITLPLDPYVADQLRSGQPVRLTGPVLAARDAAHARLVAALRRGDTLPFELAGATIYYVGPTPGTSEHSVGSAGPTTSSRMDPYTPLLLERGLRGMIGKGGRSPEVVEAIRRFGAVYFLAVGGAGALLGRHITRAELIAYPDLGPEAVRMLWLDRFPVFVAIARHGDPMVPPYLG